MVRRTLAIGAISLALAVGGALSVTLGSAVAEEPVYGSQLMTPAERAEHRATMRSAKTSEEREAVRHEHHVRMQERAKEMGIALPDEPPMRGSGFGSGKGMGPGQGMGSGKGMGRKSN